MGFWDVLFGNSNANQSQQQQQPPQQAPADAPPAQKHGDDCPNCKQAEQDCVNNCIVKAGLSGKDPGTDMEQAAKNAACMAMCEDSKERCTCAG